MRFTAGLSLGALLIAGASADCNHNNCLRAIIASAKPDRNGTGDCASYFATTVTPTTSWSTVTSIPTSIPKYASACSNSAAYSSACSCVGAVHTTKTVLPPLPTNGPVAIVSPTSCPPSAPTGSPIGHSDAAYSSAHNGLQYTEYPNSQFVVQDGTNGAFFVDLHDPSMLSISDDKGNTLVIFANGTFHAFLDHCQVEVIGSWLSPSAKRNEFRTLFTARGLASRDLCSSVQGFCGGYLGAAINSFLGSAACNYLGVQIGLALGIGVGSLGFVGGPEIGIPTLLEGIELGEALGAFLATKFGNSLCGVGAGTLTLALCNAPCSCPAGQARCAPGTSSGPCQDILSDAGNCNGCGITCSSGVCNNGACAPQVYYDDNGYDDAAYGK